MLRAIKHLLFYTIYILCVSDAYPADDIYDDVAADHDLPPEPPPPVEDELYDDIHPEEKGSKL